MKLLTLHSTPRVRKAGLIFRLLLICAFAWNQCYIPIHLVAHEHLHGGEVHADEVFGAVAEDEEHGEEHEEEEGGHTPHAASDHLSGFLAHACVQISFDVQLVPLSTDPAAPVAGHAQVSTPSLSVRGPPSLLSA